MLTPPSHALAALERCMGFALPARFIELHVRRSTEEVSLLNFHFPALGPRTLDVDRDSPFALVFHPEDYAADTEDERERAAATHAFLRARRLLPIAVSIEGLLCFDATTPRDDANWPIRSYEPGYFYEGNPDFIEWTDDEFVGPMVASSIDRVLEFRSCAGEADDASWGNLAAQFATIDPEAAGTEAGRAFWTRAVAVNVSGTTDVSR
jgi:hypothetical protein